MHRHGRDPLTTSFLSIPRRALAACARLLPGPRHARRDFLLRTLPKEAVCAEIGVWKGELSHRVLEITHPRELHLIDPWVFQPEFPTRIYGGGEARSQRDMDAIFRSVVDALGSHPAVRIHRKTSREAAQEFPDGSLDWIYLDANHSYEYVREDLERFLPKVKPGGLITGDDYRREVKRAVDELVATGRVRFVSTQKSQFVLRKPA